MEAFAPIASMTAGELRDHLLAHETDTAALKRLAPGITPEIAAAVSKLMRNQDLVLAARKCSVVTRVPQYDRPCRADVDPSAAEPSDRRSGRHRRIHCSTG